MVLVEFEKVDICGRALTVSGHAGYAEKGKDIVCAGVSAITQTLLGYLESCDIEMESSERNGYTRVVAKEFRQSVITAFEMAFIGMKLLEKKYPEHVRVIGEKIF